MNANAKSTLRRVLSALLCLAMLMSLVIVPVGAAGPVKVIDTFNSIDPDAASSGSVDAQTDGTQTEAEDVVRLPITIHDVRQDFIFFQNNAPGDERGLVSNALNTNKTDKLPDGLPQYTDAAITSVGGYVLNNTITNTYLAALVNELKTQNTWTNDWNVSQRVDELENATTAYAFADWILRHLYDEGTFTDANGVEQFYSQTYRYYDSLILQQSNDATKTAPNGQDVEYYYYDSALSTTFRGNSGTDTYIIQNNSNNALVTNGGWHPLDGPVESSTTSGAAIAADNMDALGLKEEMTTTSAHTDGKYYEHNYHHTTVGKGQFIYHKEDNLFFQFTGDDDVYLFINGKLVIDMGGTHNKQECIVWFESKVKDGIRIDAVHASPSTVVEPNYTGHLDQGRLDELAAAGNTDPTWAEYLGMNEGGICSFDFFQMERCANASNFSIYTNIKVMDSSAVPGKTAYLGTDELAYSTMVMENSDITYGFSLTNASEEEAMGVTNMTFYDSMLGVSLSKDSIELGNYGTKITDLEYAIYDYGETPANYIKLENEEQLKQLLAAGVAGSKAFAIRGFKYNVGTNPDGVVLKSIDNTVHTTVTAFANNDPTRTRTIEGDAVMRLSVGSIDDKSFIIDYVKPLTITNEDLFMTGTTHELEALDADIEATDTTAAVTNEIGTLALKNDTGLYGTMTLNEDANISSLKKYYMVYDPTSFINGVDTFELQIPVKTTIGTDVSNNTLKKDINIIPANNIYYEDDFVTTDKDDTNGTCGIYYSGTWTEVDNNDDLVTDTNNPNSNDEHHEDAETGTGKGVHGWEDNLADDTGYSDGSGRYADASQQEEGKYATATFTFTGCGVDIYSRTNKSSGTVMATLDSTDKNVEISKTLFVDTLSESDEYYQIPTLSFMTYNDEPLPHGTYKVTIYVTTAAAGRFEYYLDGIRVYNPISNEETSTSTSISDAYGKEAYANFTEVRDLLIDANSFGTDAEGNAGAVFIDSLKDGQAPEGDNTEETTPTTTTNVVGVYKDYGPKNEVYLAAGQAITFKVDEGASVYHIGLKAPSGESTTVAFSKNAETNSGTTIAHASDLYYSVEPVDGYITVKNTGSNLLSVTKIKTAGTGAETANLVLLDITAEEAVNEVAAFSLRMTEPYSTEEDTPDVEIENPTETEKPAKPIISIVLQSQLKKMLQKLFDSLNGWFH